LSDNSGLLYVILVEKNYRQIKVYENEIEFVYSKLFGKTCYTKVILSKLSCIETIRYQRVGNVYLLFSFFKDGELIAEIDEEFFLITDMINLKEYLINLGVKYIVKSKKRIKYPL
jgi:hypothetical protein